MCSGDLIFSTILGERPLNLILLFPEDFIHGTNRVRLEGRRLKHVFEVHRAKINDELCVGLMNDRIGTGRISALKLLNAFRVEKSY